MGEQMADEARVGLAEKGLAEELVDGAAGMVRTKLAPMLNEDAQAFNRDVFFQKKVDEALKEKEANFARQQAKEEGKPEHIIEKIVEGRVNSLLKEQVLLNQPFVKDTSKTIEQLVTEASARTGEKIEIGGFARFAIGA